MQSRAAPHVHGTIPAVFAVGLFDYLRSVGKDAEAVLGRTEPDPGERGEGRVPMQTWREMLERASIALDDPMLGLHLGPAFSPRHAGMLSYLLPACDTVGEALAHYARFERLFYDDDIVEIRTDETSVHVAWGESRGRPGRLVDDCAMSTFVRAIDELASSQVPLEEIHFEHDAPADVGPYERHFGCRVVFGGATTRLTWPLRLLGTRIRAADPVFRHALYEQAESLLAKRPRGRTLEARVRDAIADVLRGEGDPTLEAVARRVELTARTMRRRLDDDGTSFRDLVDAARLELAERLLRDAKTPLSEIAQRLGYSEQSAFQRSFKRWTGTTPRRHREALRAKGRLRSLR